ncbi:MAG: carboxypeptidase-like regulatory domain-containing protein [Armatimonadota bacterium]
MLRARFLLSTVIACAALLVLPIMSGAWSLVDEYSPSSGNPNGAWTYGYVDAIGGTLVTYPTNGYISDWLFLWWQVNTDVCGNINKNISSVAHQEDGWTHGMYWDPGTLCLMSNAGDVNRKTVARWTAPYSTVVHISADFTGQNHLEGSSSDVHILYNSQTNPEVYTGTVLGFIGRAANNYTDGFGTSPLQVYEADGVVAEGDTIDFVVGTNGGVMPNAGLDQIGVIADLSSSGSSSLVDLFSTSNGNPNGEWSYGYTEGLGGTFATYPTPGTVSDWLILWYSTNTDICGNVNKNISSVAHQEDTWTHGMYWDPGTLCLMSNAGDVDRKTVARWTAPYPLTTHISARFTGQNHLDGSSSDVYILHNSQTNPEVYAGTVLGFIGRAANNYTDGFGTSPLQTFEGDVTASTGDTIDFVVGTNGGVMPNAGLDQIGVTAVLSSWTGNVAGHVTRSTDGAPISGAEIKIGGIALATTDANGYYSTSQLATGGTKTLTAVKQDYLNNAQQVIVQASATTTLNFSMVPDYGWVSGFVKEGSLPILGAKVSTGTYQTTTASNGSYSLYLPSGTYSLLAEANSYASQQANGVVVTYNSTTPQDFNLTINDTYWSAEPDFSISNGNPNGVWSYGQESFTLYTRPGTETFGLEWWKPASGDDPNVTHNPTDGIMTAYGSNWPAHSLALHPGFSGEKSVVRWNAPLAGTRIYEVMALFSDIAAGLTSTDVHVLSNGTSLFDGLIRNRSEGPTPRLKQYLQWYTTTIAVPATNTIDFTVGVGDDSSYSQDTTQLLANITYVSSPDPIDVTNAQVESNTGLLVRTTGIVQSVDTTNKYFYISDGTLGGGLRVSYDNLSRHSKFSPPGVSQAVTITGLSAKANAGGVIPVVQVRWQADM